MNYTSDMDNTSFINMNTMNTPQLSRVDVIKVALNDMLTRSHNQKTVICEYFDNILKTRLNILSENNNNNNNNN